MIFQNSLVLAEIGDAAFAETRFTKRPIPASVAVTGEGNFSGTESLESVTFEAEWKVREVDESMFVSCPCFTSVKFPILFAVTGQRNQE
jgi:hypothetical protein